MPLHDRVWTVSGWAVVVLKGGDAYGLGVLGLGRRGRLDSVVCGSGQHGLAAVTKGENNVGCALELCAGRWLRDSRLVRERSESHQSGHGGLMNFPLAAREESVVRVAAWLLTLGALGFLGLLGVLVLGGPSSR